MTHEALRLLRFDLNKAFAECAFMVEFNKSNFSEKT